MWKEHSGKAAITHRIFPAFDKRRTMNMIKMRLQGTKNDIRWFLKVLGKDDRFELVDTSDMYSIKTSSRSWDVGITWI